MCFLEKPEYEPPGEESTRLDVATRSWRESRGLGLHRMAG